MYCIDSSDLSYGITICGAAQTKTQLTTNISIQKSTIRVINKALYYSDIGPGLKKFRKLKLHDLFDYRSLLFVHNYLSNKHPKFV